MHPWFEKIEKAFSEYIIGYEHTLHLLLTSILARGHVLLEGLPGIGKTFSAKVLARLLGLDFNRIQFTPDLLPGDISGYLFFNKETGNLAFRKGPVFAHFILADEINRTPPKTQSALLEAMEEYQISIEGKSHSLPTPFFVLATRNPIELSGTYNLPEAQMDRFMLMINMQYPKFPEEKLILTNALNGKDGKRTNFQTISSITDKKEIESIQKEIIKVTVKDTIIDYIIRLIQKTRSHKNVIYGPSPRTSVHLLQLARAWSVKEKRDYVIPDDIKTLFKNVVGHRIIISTEAQMENITANHILQDIITNEYVPK